MSKLTICNLQGQPVGEHDLADDLLELKRGTQAVHDAVVAHQARRRAGSASTLRKGEVAGSGIKPWKQKGTGRARAGYRQSPLWRGGGVTFGPKPRDYAKGLNKKIARLAFRRALSDRIAAGDVVVLDQLALEAPKTKPFAALLKGLKLDGGALVVVDRVDRNLALASRNVAGVEVATAAGVHIMQVLRYPKILVTRPALTGLEERLRRAAGRAS